MDIRRSGHSKVVCPQTMTFIKYFTWTLKLKLKLIEIKDELQI